MKRTTEHLEYVGEKIFEGNFLDVKIEDIFNAGYTDIIYGYIEHFNDNWERWVNCRDNCCVKVGEFHTYSKYDKNVCSKTYKNMIVSEAVNHRVQEQRTASSHNVLTPVFCFLAKPDSTASKKDDEVRSFWEQNCGCSNGEGENIYGITFDNIRCMYAKYKGCERTLKNFSLKQEQRDCVDLMLTYYNEKNGQYENVPASPVFFLLAAKCRFGKNFTILKFIEMAGFKNILFLSYKPGVFSSLADDINGHEDFKDGWCYKNNRVEKDSKPYDDKGKITTVVSTSVQQLIHDINTDVCADVDCDYENNDVKVHIRNLANSNVIKAFINKVDLLILDEAHFGGLTGYWNDIVDIIKPKMVIYVTGTASNFLNDHRFEEGINVYKYDYSDEREFHPEMPEIKIYTYEMPEYILKHKDEYDICERPTMTKLLSDYNICKNIVLTILGKGGYFIDIDRADMDFNKAMPYCKTEFEQYIMNTLWTCQTVSCAKNVVKVLEKYVSKEFEIIDCSGNDGIDDINVVKKKIRIAKYKNKKTITVTVERFREGVTVGPWGSVFLLDDCKSYNKNIQTWFRPQTPFDYFWNDMCKDKCFVFDFNPERCLEIMTKQIYEYRNTKFKTTEEWTKRVFDTMNLMYFNRCGELKSNDAVLEIMNEISRKKFEGATCDNLIYQVSSINSGNLLNLTDDDINKILNYKDIFKKGNGSGGKHVVTTNGVPGGKNGSRKRTTNNDNIPKSKRTSVIKILENIIKRLPRFLILSDSKYENLKNVVDDIEHNINSSILFEDIMKIDSSFFIEIIYNNNIIEEYKFKYFIEDFYRQFNNTKTTSEWEEFENRWVYLDGKEKDIPFDVIEEIGVIF